jgi:CheY-like chemotaxis protein
MGSTDSIDVLIVDDDEAVRTAVADVLREEGFEVSEAQDGEQALAMLRRSPPDVVLLDLMMPRVDGWQVVEAMRSSPPLANVPVMVLTAFNARVGLPVDCHVLHKPLERDVLISEIRALAGTPPVHAP